MKTKFPTDDYLEIAFLVAKQHHEGQFRKDGKTPYISHPQEVKEELERIGVRDRIILAAALLHDVLEDCATNSVSLFLELHTKHGIAADKAAAIVQIVEQMSSPDKHLSTQHLFKRHVRKTMMARHFRYVSPETAMIKIIDRKCNISDSKTLEPDFRALYAKETLKLVIALKSRIFGMSEDLQDKFTKICNDMVTTCNRIMDEHSKSIREGFGRRDSKVSP